MPVSLSALTAPFVDSPHRATAALVVFALTYLVIALQELPFTHLDRPSGALLGAVLMVALGVLDPAEVYQRAVSWDTIGLLLGMMVLVAYLGEASFFRRASWLSLHLAGTPRGLLVGVTLTCALLSAFLVNDTVCVMVTPLVLQLVDDAHLPPRPYLLAVAMGANVGSVATFTGNPQNMLVGQLSRISYARFAAVMAPIAVAASLLCAAILLALFRRELPRERFVLHAAPPPVDRPLLSKSLTAFALVVIAFFAGLPTSWSALGAASALALVGGRPPSRIFARVDFLLLLFFAGLFAVVHGLSATGWTERIYAAAQPFFGQGPTAQTLALSALSLVASNVVSNVPFVMLAGKWVGSFASPTLTWYALALSSTLAGNLTLVGSVANIIVVEASRDRARISFGQYLAAGVPVTLATTALGTGMLLALWAMGWV